MTSDQSSRQGAKYMCRHLRSAGLAGPSDFLFAVKRDNGLSLGKRNAGFISNRFLGRPCTGKFNRFAHPDFAPHTVSQPVHITVQSLHDNLGSIGAFNQQVILVLHLTKALQL